MFGFSWQPFQAATVITVMHSSVMTCATVRLVPLLIQCSLIERLTKRSVLRN